MVVEKAGQQNGLFLKVSQNENGNETEADYYLENRRQICYNENNYYLMAEEREYNDRKRTESRSEGVCCVLER